MKSYRYPSKSSEVAFCRLKPNVTDCANGHGYDLKRNEVTLASLEMKPSSLGNKAGRGVFAKKDISENSYIGLGELASSIYISAYAYEVSNKLNKIPWVYSNYHGKEIEKYTDVYGHFFSNQVSQVFVSRSLSLRATCLMTPMFYDSILQGDTEVFIDSTIQCMINHGCVGTNNVGYNIKLTEETADPSSIPEEVLSPITGRQFVYNPARERQVHFYSSSTPHRNILAGEELLDNYLGMTGK
eukprot:jgi/Psemu1/301002/fgenesh1_kg.23_\